ncbi:MAG: 3-oxoacyl-ACP reductase FabG [Oscillospiraceae bacterium]|jgi:NAD(P)-dependent dehydrogenase (short-subunit alcohol dehydrogenase family)|nr:3-oxoacyl-ACP reductase FabG [Oscillospiraceae bacterium]
MLKDQVAIITGGTRGIGYAIVEKYLENHAAVVLCGSRQETADKAVAALKAKDPTWKVEGIAPDLTDYASVKEAFQGVQDRYGRIDILVNNAGLSSSDPLSAYTPEMFRKVMALNVDAVFYCIRAVYDAMAAQRSGCIINTSSVVSRFGQPSGVAYPTSKFAINGLTLSLARELGPQGIRVNAVAPGITNTDMMKAVPENVITPLINQIPLRRIGEPEDLANAFLFLASPAASYITGEILHVGGQVRT